MIEEIGHLLKDREFQHIAKNRRNPNKLNVSPSENVACFICHIAIVNN